MGFGNAKPLEFLFCDLEVTFFGDQGGKPTDLLSVFGGFLDHTAKEGGLSALGPEFVGLAAEVQGGGVVGLDAKLLPLEFCGGVRGFSGFEEGRVAHRKVEVFVGQDDIAEDGVLVGLLADNDSVAKPRVELRDGSSDLEGSCVYIGANHSPAIFLQPEDGIDEGRSGPDVEAECAILVTLLCILRARLIVFQ